MSYIFKSISILVVFFINSAFALETSQNIVTPMTTEYSCEQADALKFNKDEYKKLDGTTRVIVDAQWQQCQIQAEKDKDDQVVMIVNPTPSSDNDRLFYGVIKRKQLEEAQKTCNKGGEIAGVSLMVIGAATGTPAASEIGSAAFEYTNVSCSSVAAQLQAGNVLAALMPSMIVNHAVINKMTKGVVSSIPLLSGADKKNIKNLLDKATTPPSVSVGDKHVVIKAGGAKLSIPKKCCKVKL